MGLLSVLAERFSMIAGQQDECGARIQAREKLRKTFVVVGDFSVVLSPGEALAVGGRRLVGSVRLVEMHPDEKLLPLGPPLSDPFERVIDRLFPAPLHEEVALPLSRVGRELIVKGRKAAADPGAVAKP